LEQFGGHMYAAGMTLKAENYQTFKEAFETQVSSTILPEMRTPEIEIDAEINFSDITPKLIRILKQFEPFGPLNMTPVFMTKDIKDTGYAKTLGAEEEHLRLFVKQNNSDGIAAIGFGLGKKLDIAKNQTPFQLAYSLAENEWNGTVSNQLMLKDIRTNEN
jgi:single-stranded-DNA-specific exonuclease